MRPVDADPSRAPGDRLGPYTLVRVIGQGGMGTVYLATDGGGRKVAIKVIRRDEARKPDYLERFRREVTAAQQVRPFCTAPVLDARLDGDPLYVVTEYVQGPTLEDVISRYGPRDGADLEGLAAGVATALAAIHSAGVVHRDLKPANILLSPFGPRVIDFGIARTIGVDAPMTQANQTMGTPSYMAPEGLIGEPITAAADVFSWGCVVAYAGTGRLPFFGRQVGETLYRTVHGEPDLDGLEPRLRALVARSLAKRPADRPDAAGLLEELTGLSDPGRVASRMEEKTEGPPPVHDGRTQVVRGRGKRFRLLVAGGVVLAVAALAAAAVVVWPKVAGEPGPPHGDLVAEQDFDGRDAGWGPGSGGGYEREAAGGAFVMTTRSPLSWQSKRAPMPEPQAGLVLAADVRVVSTDPLDEAGLFCRSTDGGTQYEVLLSRAGQVRIRKGTGGGATGLGRSSSAVAEAGAEVPLRAVCASTGKGVRIEAWNGGTRVVGVDDPAGPAGGFVGGLVSGREARAAGTSATRARFDDFRAHRR